MLGESDSEEEGGNSRARMRIKRTATGGQARESLSEKIRINKTARLYGSD